MSEGNEELQNKRENRTPFYKKLAKILEIHYLTTEKFI